MFKLSQLFALTAVGVILTGLCVSTGGAYAAPRSSLGDCTCPGDDACADYQCPLVASTVCDVTKIQDGECDLPGCSAKQCKWHVNLAIQLIPGATKDLQTFVDGQQRQIQYGASFASVDTIVRLDCDGDESIALGYDDMPCVEAVMRCDGCSAGG
jgi:hypothetical protein